MALQQFFKDDYRGKLYPDGEFGVTTVRKSEISFSRKLERTKEQERALEAVRVYGVSEAILFSSIHRNRQLDLPLGEQAQKTGVPLDLTEVSNSENSPKGLKGLTRRGKRRIRHGAYLIEQRSPINLLTFLTITIPAVSHGVMKDIVSEWGAIVEHLMKSLRRRLSIAGLPDHVIGCVEVQEKRQVKEGGLPLHLHILFKGRHRGKGWAIKPGEVRSAWKSAVENYVSMPDEVEWKGCVDIKRLRKSAYRYMSKYVSKGVGCGELLRELHDQGWRIPPKWYICTKALVEWVESETFVLRGAVASFLVDLVDLGSKLWIKNFRWKRLEMNGRESFTVGGAGFLSAIGFSRLKELLTLT